VDIPVRVSSTGKILVSPFLAGYCGVVAKQIKSTQTQIAKTVFQTGSKLRFHHKKYSPFVRTGMRGSPFCKCDASVLPN